MAVMAAAVKERTMGKTEHFDVLIVGAGISGPKASVLTCGVSARRIIRRLPIAAKSSVHYSPALGLHSKEFCLASSYGEPVSSH